MYTFLYLRDGRAANGLPYEILYIEILFCGAVQGEIIFSLQLIIIRCIISYNDRAAYMPIGMG